MSKQPVPEVSVPTVSPEAKATLEHDTSIVEHDNAPLSSSDADMKEKLARLNLDEAVLTSVDTAKEPVVTRRELWSYYLYYNGDCGTGPNGYSMTLFQSMATAAGWDPVKGRGSSCTALDASGQCVLPWAGGTKAVSSVVLIASGITFAVMTFIFTTIGSAADYGTFGRWLLFIVTIICWASQYASMALTSPDRWRAAMGVYIVGFITYGATLVFYAALFPRLARNTSHSRALREKYENGEISREDYEVEESMEKNRISNISTVCLCLELLLQLGSRYRL
jgi:hypothetical protein